jgi:predicted RNase H-like nuclease (RuvC/YqgF family)
MKRSLFVFVLLICAFASASAQQPARTQQPSSEQSLQELVAEVRQLRATLQRMNAAIYKGQVLLERVKIQQEQVNRISRELTEVREQLSEVRVQQSKMKETLRRLEVGVETGLKNPDEASGWKAEVEQINQREQRLALRETQLATDLEGARAILDDLNNKLNALVEIEMTPK